MRVCFHWLFRRLSPRFALPLLLLATAYFAYVLPVLVYRFVPWLGTVLRQWCCESVPRGVGHAIRLGVTLGLAVIGIVLVYALAAAFYGFVRGKPMPKLQVHDASPPGGGAAPRAQAPAEPKGHNPLADYRRIGIILAGGGAKGAYQAGALQAIYEYLDTHGAHDKVRMIAGTSIGSWNAMFWLADLIRSPDDAGSGLLRQWWEQVDTRHVIRPVPFTPFRQNYFLSSDPWKEVFDRIFVENESARERLESRLSGRQRDALHFYFTHSNVERARLEFLTNHAGVADIPPAMQSEKRPRPVVQGGQWTLAESIDDVKRGVFSSMDLPPLFEYTRWGHHHYEDGGVVDNLPIRFGTEFEGCDLLFVLPLNASFTDDVNTTSVSNRLFRVMNVRQGVMERNSFKLVYLYNELAALRERSKLQAVQLKALERQLAAANIGTPSDVEIDPQGAPSKRALDRTHQPLHVVAICPGKPLLLETSDFWSTEAAGRAFSIMHEATTSELQKFTTNRSERDWIGVAIVNPHGEVTYLEDF